MKMMKFALLAAGVLAEAPALAQTEGGTANTGPQGSGNFVAGKPEGNGNFGLVQPDGSGPRSPVSRKATATSSKDRE